MVEGAMRTRLVAGLLVGQKRRDGGGISGSLFDIKGEGSEGMSLEAEGDSQCEWYLHSSLVVVEDSSHTIALS